jgi:hypothetical protein
VIEKEEEMHRTAPPFFSSLLDIGRRLRRLSSVKLFFFRDHSRRGVSSLFYLTSLHRC